MSVRAFFQVAKVENAASPYDTIHLKVFYPAQRSASPQEQDMGIVPADEGRSPFKVVIFFNGINCGPEIYQWLTVKLAECGLVVVTFAWVAQNLPGIVALTPGVELKNLAPNTYGTAPTASALPTLLAALERLQSEGVLAGLLDLDHIILGGHSAGGRVAIESADPRFFSQVVGAFAYGAHTAAIVQLGYPPNTILPLPDALPLMLIGGTCDGVIAKSSHRYGVDWEHATTPITRSFQEAIAGNRGDSYLLLLEGANHFSIAHPFDSTTGRPFLDFPATQPEEQLRNLIAEAINLFIDAHVRHQLKALETLNRYSVSDNPLIAAFERK
ncbi:alpha/beta hydrolase family protein [Chroogloeocystis siderophila]|uniref:Dienelactone hydrolase n=1 Tax=Chroogloeocystis siderophila 5.2 s.c.1 TaxID=247279 RepID=A0A1U7HHW6_9CHRO|nr:dienelactone hydrolase [Chroogloeocystis siderophila]OKH23151.1 dienelactone hydrolase [Chroogloeocystis siderophila 5.2 s.c.1]